MAERRSRDAVTRILPAIGSAPLSCSHFIQLIVEALQERPRAPGESIVEAAQIGTPERWLLFISDPARRGCGRAAARTALSSPHGSGLSPPPPTSIARVGGSAGVTPGDVALAIAAAERASGRIRAWLELMLEAESFDQRPDVLAVTRSSSATRRRIGRPPTASATTCRPTASRAGSRRTTYWAGATGRRRSSRPSSGARLCCCLLSQASNRSDDVKREVGRASSKGVPIVPFFIENITLSKHLEYFLATTHWLGADTRHRTPSGAPDRHRARSAAGAQSQRPQAGAETAPAPASPAASLSPEKLSGDLAKYERRSSPRCGPCSSSLPRNPR